MLSSALFIWAALASCVLGGVFQHADNHAQLTALQKRHKGNEHLDAHLIHVLAMNHAHRRRARMAGHPPPSDASLRRALRKRQLQVEEDTNSNKMLRKRARVGHAAPDFSAIDTDSLVKASWTAVGPPLNEAAAAKGQGGLGGKGGASSAAGAGAEGGEAATATAAAASGTLANAQGFPSADAAVASGNPVTPANNPTAANTVGENIEGRDSGYFAAFTIGTPGQKFNLLLDSGSSDLWMPGADCVGCNHETLGTNSSSSFKATNTPWAITFGTGQVAGTLCQDNVNVAGLSLANHKFGVTSQETVDFTDPSIPFDGLMGVAKNQLSEQNQSTVPESLAANKLASSQMGFKLGRVSDGNNDGQATFGGVDTTKFDGNLTELDNVSKLGFFEVAMDGSTVNGQDLGLQGRTAILDTGTTLMILPQQDATTVHAAIPGSATDGQGNFAVPCNNQAVVALQMGGQSFTINPSDVAFLPVDAAQPNGMCISGIGSGQIGGPQEWLVGDTFIKNVYFATDADNSKIGLAALPNAVPDASGVAAASDSSGTASAGGKAEAGAGQVATVADGAATSAATANPAAAGQGGVNDQLGRRSKRRWL